MWGRYAAGWTSTRASCWIPASEVEEVIVFGSFENDTYAPGSDLDVFIVLSEADDSPRDRIARFLPDKSLDVPVDVFPFTRAEMEERRDSPLLAAARRSNWRYRR